MRDYHRVSRIDRRQSLFIFAYLAYETLSHFSMRLLNIAFASGVSGPLAFAAAMSFSTSVMQLVEALAAAPRASAALPRMIAALERSLAALVRSWDCSISHLLPAVGSVICAQAGDPLNFTALVF